VAAIDIAQGEQVLRNKLKRPEEMARRGRTLSQLTSEGMRAITIGSDALSGVGGFIRPGDRIDIHWTHAARGEEVVTLTLFQNVHVLAVGDQMLGRAPAEGVAGGNYTVTLELTPEQAELLLFAREQGNVQLSLRSPDEKLESIPVAPINTTTFMQSVFGRAVVEERQPQRVEVFKGLDRNVVSVDQ
jgi:pilus assembly protein CpaB